MNKIVFFLFTLANMQIVLSCPTCVGRIKNDSKPFFEAEQSQKIAYNSHQTKKFSTVYENYMKQKQGKQ